MASPLPHGRIPKAQAPFWWLAVGMAGIAVLSTAGLAVAADWPQFLGPHRDGSTTDDCATHWPAAGPRAIWSRAVGGGFSGPVVVGGRLLLHQRRGSDEVLECLDAVGEPGRLVWSDAYRATYRDDFGFDDGPRATPCVAGDRVFTWGAAGVLTCVDLESGRRRWQVDAAKDLRADKGFFGFASSPVVHRDLVLLNVGGQGAGVVAFEVETGKVRWRATDDEAGYASPVLAAIRDRQQALCFTREGLVILDPETGKVGTEFRWRSRQHASVNAAAPLALGNRVFLSASYGTGAVLLDLEGGTPVRVWSGDDQLSSHYASVVHHRGFLFGFHGRQEYGPSLRCLEAATGTVRWSVDDLGAGTVILARDQLVVLTERGELIVAPASPDTFRPLARAQVLGSGVRAYPALANGRFYARDTKRLVGLDVASRPAPQPGP